MLFFVAESWVTSNSTIYWSKFRYCFRIDVHISRILFADIGRHTANKQKYADNEDGHDREDLADTLAPLFPPCGASFDPQQVNFEGLFLTNTSVHCEGRISGRRIQSCSTRANAPALLTAEWLAVDRRRLHHESIKSGIPCGIRVLAQHASTMSVTHHKQTPEGRSTDTFP